MSNLVESNELKQLKATISLPAMKEQFKAALPPHINVDKFVRVIMTAISTTNALVQAERNSFFAACLKSAADGLIPDGKEAAITTYKNKSGQQIAQYMPMVGGILKKVRNSGELSTITSEVVFKNDIFKYGINTDGVYLNHEPNIFEDRGEAIGVYALAKTKDGGVYIEFMSRGQVNDIKNASKASNGPWDGAFKLEMWRKSVIRRLSKRLPMSTDIDMTLHADDELFNSPPEQEIPAESVPQEKTVGDNPPPPPVKKKSLADKMKQAKAETPVTPEAKAEEIPASEQTVDTSATQTEPLSDEDTPI